LFRRIKEELPESDLGNTIRVRIRKIELEYRIFSSERQQLHPDESLSGKPLPRIVAGSLSTYHIDFPAAADAFADFRIDTVWGGSGNPAPPGIQSSAAADPTIRQSARDGFMRLVPIALPT